MTPEEYRQLKLNQTTALEKSSLRHMHSAYEKPKKKAHQVAAEKMRAIVADPNFIRYESGAFTFSMVPRTNSLNRAAIIGKSARMVKTTPARIWVEAVHRWFSFRPFHPMSGPITLQVCAYVANIGADIDAPLKQLMDVCTGCLWHDDSQVVNLHVEKRAVKKGKRAYVWMRCMPASLIDAETIERLQKSDRANGRKSR